MHGNDTVSYDPSGEVDLRVEFALAQKFCLVRSYPYTVQVES